MTDLTFTLKSRLQHNRLISHLSQALRARAQSARHLANIHLGGRTGRRFASVGNYFRRNRVAGYIGWVGNGNVGDEAIFQAFCRLFPRHQAVNFDRVPIELQLHRRFVASEPFYDFITLGGGTLFSFRCYYYQLKSALHAGVPVWTFGTGVDDPELLTSQYFAPGQFSQREHLAGLRDFAQLLHEVRLITVRGPRTARVLQDLGVAGVRVIGDPALGACQPMPPAGGKRAAINLAMWKDRGGSDAGQTLAAVQAAVRYLLDKGWHVDFVPTARGDRHMGAQLAGPFSGRVRILGECSSADAMIHRLRSYDLLVGERLHSLVLAAGSGVPSIGLEYSPKCRDFMESIGMERFCLGTASLTPEVLIGAIDAADAGRAELNRTLNERCNAFRRLQRDAAAEVNKLISPVALA